MAINTSVFSLAFFVSWNFLQRRLFSEQDLSQARVNKFLFSFTFGFCVLMLLFFLEEVRQSFDPQTSLRIWKLSFLVMDFMLLVVIPLALIKDFCCGQAPRKSKRFKNRVVSIFGCACFGIIFIVDVFIFNTYFDKASLFDS